MNGVSNNTKIIHWDYTAGNVGELSQKPDIKMRIGIIKNGTTHKPDGVWFRYTIRLYSHKGLFLSTIAENKYKAHNIPAFTLPDVLRMMQTSLAHSHTSLRERGNEEGFAIPEISYQFTQIQAESILGDLQD